jgi:hypothetical protein
VIRGNYSDFVNEDATTHATGRELTVSMLKTETNHVVHVFEECFGTGIRNVANRHRSPFVVRSVLPMILRPPTRESRHVTGDGIDVITHRSVITGDVNNDPVTRIRHEEKLSENALPGTLLSNGDNDTSVRDDERAVIVEGT